MKPNPDFLAQPKKFWAHVRSISQAVGYTSRGTGAVKIPSRSEIIESLSVLGLKHDHLYGEGGPSDFALLLERYFAFRASVLNNFVQPNLMDKNEAALLYDQVKSGSSYSGPVPMNKQKGEKRAPAFLTAIVTMLIHDGIDGRSCNFDPRHLTSITKRGLPIRTLARRIDGAFPSVVNPIAIWEIKEYYYTTTFGSRVADGVYETLLDGMELEELRCSENVDVKHYLFLDDRYTWWGCGRSYLCRIIDMLHMGYVDEAIFGREVLEAIPRITREWVAIDNL